MSENLLEQLQQSAELALQSQSLPEGLRHLSQAFVLFSKEVERLKTAYAKLQERFDGVNRELAAKVGELKQTSFFLHNTLKNISEAILFIDLEGTIAIANEAAQKLLEMKGETILFRRYWDIFSDEHFGFSMKEALQFGISHRLLYKNLGTKELEISTNFVYEGPKAYHGLVTLLRDISEKKRLQLLAHRIDRMKELGEMAASLAHEIRNPLGGIRGYASLLYRDLEKEKHLQEMAGFIIEGTKALESLVTTVLHYARPLQIQPQSLEIGKFLLDLAKFVKVDPAFPPSASLQLHVPQTPLLAPIDPVALKSALLNLIFNAIQALPHSKGVVTLSLFKLESCYQIAVSDTGIGIDAELLPKLFSPFFTTKEKGTGLGLVEVQKIIHAHQGNIDVRSMPQKGTTFTIALPLKR